MPGEFSLIDWIRQQTLASPAVPVGIGDDAALLTITPGEDLLVTTDMLMDGRHFRVSETAPDQIGRKAMAVNLSDIAAMAGRPLAAFVSWALPRSGGRALAEGLFHGLHQMAREYGVSIAGGDTNSWDGPLVINVTLIGETVQGRRVLRSAAQPGDQIYVTGPLGGSLSHRHLTFTPRLHAARELVQRVDLHAMLDLSDGVASDLRHILRASDVGATLIAEQIPVHSDVSPNLAIPLRIQHALTDGEDFELLFTAPAISPEVLTQLREQGVDCYSIGTIRSAPGCTLRLGGQEGPLPVGGWEHSID